MHYLSIRSTTPLPRSTIHAKLVTKSCDSKQIFLDYINTRFVLVRTQRTVSSITTLPKQTMAILLEFESPNPSPCLYP